MTIRFSLSRGGENVELRVHHELLMSENDLTSSGWLADLKLEINNDRDAGDSM